MQRREVDFRSFDEVIADVEKLSGCTCAHAGNWDLGQAVGHLAISVNCSMDGFPSKMPWLIRKLLKRVAFKQVMATRNIRPGFKIKGQFIPALGVDVAAALGNLKQAIARFEAHQGEMAQHPFFEKLSKEQWRQLHLIHSAHHLSFQVRG